MSFDDSMVRAGTRIEEACTESEYKPLISRDKAHNHEI